MEGNVIMRFTVDQKGAITDVHALNNAPKAFLRDLEAFSVRDPSLLADPEQDLAHDLECQSVAPDDNAWHDDRHDRVRSHQQQDDAGRDHGETDYP